MPPIIRSGARGNNADAGDGRRPIRFFQKYLSGADGHRCPMTPSCSSYALQAMRRHGALKGWIMACDRLMRCGRDELKHSPSTLTRHGIRCQDPVQNNDFWLH